MSIGSKVIISKTLSKYRRDFNLHNSLPRHGFLWFVFCLDIVVVVVALDIEPNLSLW